MATFDMTNPYEQIWKTRDLRALNTPVELDNRIPEWKRGLNAFGKEMQATGYGLLALGSQGVENVVGENSVTKGITDWGLEGYNKSIEESQSGLNAPSVARVEDIKNFSDATDWASYQLGKGLPMLGSLALSGGVGGAVARVGASAGVKALAKSAVGSAVEKAVATKAVQAAEGEIVTEAMKAAAAQSLRDTFTKGAIAGGFAGSFGLEGGQAFGEQVSQGVAPADAVKTAAVVGGINGLLEFLPFYKVAKGIGLGSYAKRGIAEIIASDAGLSKKALELAKEVGGRALKGGAEGAAVEGVTEGLQELVSIAGERWAKNDKLFADLTDNDWSRIKNSAITGAMVGGVAAGAGATLGGPQTQETVLPPAETSPTQTSTPPIANETQAQSLETTRSKIDADLIEAQAAGNTAAVEELQQIKARFDRELDVETSVQETPIETSPAQSKDAARISTESAYEAANPNLITMKEMQAKLNAITADMESARESGDMNKYYELKKLQKDQSQSIAARRVLMNKKVNKTPPVIQTVPPTQEVISPVQETPLDIPPVPPVTEQASIVNPPGTTAQGIAAGFNALGAGIDTAARIKARDDLLNGTPQIFKKPAAINAAKANPAYNLEDLADGSARIIGVLDPDTNTWAGKPPAAQQAPVTQQTPSVTQPPVPPRLGETVQLKQGEEIVLTPQGQPETKIVPTAEEKANLQQLLGERPTNTQQASVIQPEVIQNAEEVQTQTEASINPNIPTAPLPDTGPGSDNTRFSMPQQQAQVISNPVNFDEEGIFEHVFTENETPTVAISGKYDSGKKELYIKRIDKNPKLNERKGLGIEALQNLIKTTEVQGKPVDIITTEASESFVKSLKRSIFADKLTVTDIPGIKEKDVVIDLTGHKTNTTTSARLTQARQGMTEEERQQQSPQSMQEYPNEDQIVVMQGEQSLSAEQGPFVRKVTPDELRVNINSVMGDNWIQQAEAAGIVEVIDEAGPRGESGSWAGDKFRLYAQTMPADGSPLGVLLHEGSHAPTFNEILGNSLEGYLKDLDTLADNGNQTARNAIAQATIAAADVLGIKHNLMQGGNKTDLKNIQALIEERKPGLLAEEKLAYFIQYASETKDGAGFLKRLVNAIKTWFTQTQLGQALKQAGIGFELNEAMAVEWAKASLRNSLAEAQQAARAREKVIAEAKEMPPSERLGRALEAQYSFDGSAQDAEYLAGNVIPLSQRFNPNQDDIRYSLGLQEFKDTLWTDPTDSRQDFVNKPGLLQKFRANFIDFFAEIEKKSTQVYDAYSLLRNKKAARLVQARQEYMFPLRDLIAKSPWTSKEVGDMLAARHVKVDNVNTRLAERASYKYTKELLKSLSDAKRKELMKARSNVKSGMMPDGSKYIDANGNPATMSARTKQKLMFDLMNKYVEFEMLNPDGKQELRFEWEIFKDAAAGFSNGGVGKGIVRSVDEVLAGTSKDQARFDKIANLFDAMNRHALQIREDGGLITPAEHARLLLDKTAYAPLRRESYNVDREIEQLFRHAGQGGSKQLGTRTGTAALSEPTLVLQNALAALEASAAAAERNLANQELYKVINADKEAWKPWFSIVDTDKYSTHDEDGFLQDRNATASNRADITLINKGKKLVIRPNMHNERAMGFVRAVNNLDSQVISGPMSVLNFFNNIVRWVNVTASPAFLMMNAIRDPGTALYNMQATEAAPYTKEIFANYGKSFKALKKVFLDGNRDPTDADVKMVEAFENAGGRTSFVEQLNPSDDTWRSFDAQVARRQGSMKQIMAAKDKWIDGLENFNVLFENVMRLSTFNVLVDKGTSKTRAARIAQDLTTNFTRRGYKTQALGNWWVFFNASVQGNYQVVRNLLSSKKLQVWAGGTIVFALMLDLLGRAVADDWDEIPEWDKERFIILPIKVAGDFVKIPAPWVYNVLWRAGGMFGETLAGVRKPQDMALDLAALTATTFNPLGKPGSIAQAVAPTAADPFVQILENKDFAGNPIGPEGFPGAGNKVNSELLWNSTPKGYQSVARFVNELTGGSAVESGAVDLRPGDYQLLAKFLTGSLGRFLSDTTFGLKENLEKGIGGPKEIPIVKEFFAEPYNPMRSQQYHTNIAATYGAYKLEKMYKEGPERDLIKLHEVRQTRSKDLRMYSQAQDVERQIKSLRVRIRAAENRNDNARVEMLRGRIEEIQEKFNTAYKQKMS